MSSALEGPPWEPGPGEEQCEATSGWCRCQRPAGHRGGHFMDLGDTMYSWPNKAEAKAPDA